MTLRVLLFLVGALPALAVSWGAFDGEVVFVLYREPKLAASLIGATVLLAALAWLRPATLNAAHVLPTLKQPAVVAGSAFLVWSALSGFWARVPELYFYEVQQYAVLGCLWVVLVTWFREDPEAAGSLRFGLVFGCAVVTLLGWVQWSSWFPALQTFLYPIDPQFGATHPSLMGYKNPAALAITGQIFLVASIWASSRDRRLKAALGLLLLFELVYVASLHSRTCYAALAVGGVFAWVLLLSHRLHRRYVFRRSGLGALAAAVFLAALLWNPATAERASSMPEFLSVDGYLASDRGIYLRNTLHMVESYPAGVGLGQWQAFYPVFRKHERYRSFDDSFQVRRAHSDHVQTLGETGRPGLVLWAVWLGLLIGTPARRYASTGGWHDFFVTVQLVVTTTAMATDYVTEMPYHKLQFFLVASLALCRSGPRPDIARGTMPMTSRALIRAAGLTLIAGAVLVLQSQALRKAQISGEILRRHQAVLESLSQHGRVDRDFLRDARALGRSADRLHGWSKTSHRRHLAAAHMDLLLADTRSAQQEIACALDVHPFSPKAVALMAQASSGEESLKWMMSFRHIMHEAVDESSVDPLEILTKCRE